MKYKVTGLGTKDSPAEIVGCYVRIGGKFPFTHFMDLSRLGEQEILALVDVKEMWFNVKDCEGKRDVDSVICEPLQGKFKIGDKVLVEEGKSTPTFASEKTIGYYADESALMPVL